MAKLFGRGFNVVEEESKRREMAQESRKGKLYRFFFGKNVDEVEIDFLTEEPICYNEHSVKVGENFNQIPCIGDGCPYCKEGRPRFVGAWLIVDHSEYQAKVYDENGVDTGKKKTVKDRIKLLVRGTTDASSLKRLSEKYGLTNRPYTVTKTGTGKNTKWDFDRGEPRELSKDYIKQLREQLPEKLRNLDFYKIVELQISDDEQSKEEEVKETVANEVQKLEDAPAKTGIKRFVKK